MLKFDAQTARILDDAYQGSDIVKRRMANFDALDLRAGDRVLDIGCGTGLLTLELSRAVGERGHVIAIDPSAEMRDYATSRCSVRENIEIHDGSANDLPLADGCVDKAVSVQVFEYVEDIPGALVEIGRVLCRGGRLVIGDMHWDTMAMFTDDRPRMGLMRSIWDRHMVERRVPAVLPAMMEDAGFAVEEVRPLTYVDRTLRPDGLAHMMIVLMKNYTVQKELLDPAIVEAWADEQFELARTGRFFFTISHFVVAATKR